MFPLEAHHHEERVGADQHLCGLLGRLEAEIGPARSRTLKKLFRPVRVWADHHDFQIARGLDLFD